MRITIILIILTIQVSCKNRNETNSKSENSSITELPKCNYNNEAINKYHILTNKAEIAICNGDFDRASKNYSLAFKEINKPFGSDVYNAALSNQLSNNLDERNLNLQLLINNSDDLSMLKSIFVNTYIDENLWNSFIEKRTTEYDSRLRNEFKSIWERDQLFRPMYDTHDDTIQANRIINMKRILSITDSLAFPNNLGDTITLKFPTFTETAEMAGISRVLGGYHIQADNVAGLELGRNVAKEVWKFYKVHIGEE